MRKFALPRVLLCLTVFGLIAGALSSQSAPGPYEILPFEDAYIIEAWMDLLFEDNVNRADWTGWVGTTWESPNAYNGHGGTDFSLDTCTPLYAPVAGVVSEVVNNIPENNHTMNYYGNYVKIQVAGSGPSGEALDVILAHQLPQVQVSVGQNVSVGQLVGYSDNTGQSTSEHIHLESLIRGASDGICPFYHGHFKYPIMFNPSGSVQVGHVIRVTAASTPVRSDRFETSSQITTAYQNQIYFAAYGKRGFYCIFIPGSASWRTGWIRAIDAEEVFTGTVIQALPDPGLYIHDAQLQAPFAVKASPDAGAAGISQILWGGGRFVADQVQNGWYRIPVPGSASWGWVQPNARMIVYPQLHNPAINPAALPSKDFPISESFISPGPNMFGRPKYNRCFVTDFSPAAPGGDGKVLFLTDAHNYGNGYEECVTVGRINHRNYYVESRVYLDYKPGYFPKKEYHRYGIFARDDGFSSMDRTFEGKGNCYALIYDSDDGRIRAGKFVDAVVTDFLSTARYITADGWHT
ncbi:MAG TPA: M23 family metallopeptidase, partial [Candidatus Sumerlaeota bacterium]|nr:M23 family metallopeptidase [Candidatus Sumerlaeota bacterium]